MVAFFDGSSEAPIELIQLATKSNLFIEILSIYWNNWMVDRTVLTASHWGAYHVSTDGRKVSSPTPFSLDTSPSQMMHSAVEAAHSTNRVSQPMVRQGWLNRNGTSGRGKDPFIPVRWETALRLVAEELQRVRTISGNMSIFGGSYGWSSAGRFHHARSQLHRFLNCFGGFIDQTTNYSYAAGMTILPYVLGSHEAVSGPITSFDVILSHTKILLCFGGLPLKNTQIEAGGIGDHATAGWLRRCRDAGVKTISISPLRDRGEISAWFAIRPNTDTAMMLGLAHFLLSEGRVDRDFLDRYTVGFDRLEAYLLGREDGIPKSADWASKICGLPSDKIRKLANEISRQTTMINVSWAVQRADHGEQPYWMAVALAAMLGQIGTPGGGVAFGYSSVGSIATPRRRFPSPSLPVGINSLKAPIPVARIADALLNPGHPYVFNGKSHCYPDIRLIYWCGGNPFHHHQDLNRLVRAWRRPETIIVHEPWWTATAKHADIVLPATTTFERNDIAASSRDRFIIAMKKAIEPQAQAMNDHEIFANLAKKLNFEDEFREGRDEWEWLHRLYDVARTEARRDGTYLPDFQTFWEKGFVEIDSQSYEMLSDFRRDPEHHPLATPSGKIELFSQRIASFKYGDCPGHPTWLEPCEWLGQPSVGDRLHLLTVQPENRLHSQLDFARASQEGKTQRRERILINPIDAKMRKIEDADIVQVYNTRGACLAAAQITNLIRQGVAAMATGAWYDPLKPGESGSLEKHGNPNVLTIDSGASSLSQGPKSGSCLVHIRKYDGTLPELTAYDLPQILEPLGDRDPKPD